MNEFAGVIAAGGSEVTLIFGSEAISTIEHYAKAEDRPDFTEHPGGSLEDRGYALRGISSMHQAAHGLTDGPSQYALAENARRARLKQTREEYAVAMGALFAPFTRVAAANPHASAPVERSAAELVTPTESNRLIADPYTRYIVAREKVNQGAAVLLMSVAAADRLGVPPGRRVFLHGHADLRERTIMDRADLSAGRPPCWPSGTRSTWLARPSRPGHHRLVQLLPGTGVQHLRRPGPGSRRPARADRDRRAAVLRRAGNGYSMHAIAETVQWPAARPAATAWSAPTAAC